MVKKEFYPLDFGYDNTGNVVIYGKTTGNERIVVKDDSIKPFFYVFENGKKAGEIENVRIKEENKIYKVLKTEIVKKKYFDKDQPWLRSKSFKKAYMTCMLQALINEGYRVDPIMISRGWLEFDTAEDYEKYNKWLKDSSLGKYFCHNISIFSFCILFDSAFL